MYQNIFDSHAHYDDEKFDPDRAEIIESLNEKGVCHVVNIACDMPSCETGIALTEAYPFFSCSVGVHPHAASSFIPGDLDILAGYTSRSKVVAIGEIGLDYHYDFSPRDIQKQVFEAHQQFAVVEASFFLKGAQKLQRVSLDFPVAQPAGDDRQAQGQQDGV